MKNSIKGLVYSWANTRGNVNDTQDIIKWINNLNENIHVNINKVPLEQCKDWYIQDGEITNKNKSFFSIRGIRNIDGTGETIEQPIIIQKEIGYLGIICKEIDGVINFLMQAKIEPGNVNKIQISPTIQATKSNFMQKHGGKKPAYLDYFMNVREENIIVDQIQSEQSSRFYKKRNRNIIIKVDEEIEILANYRWMTLGQIKELMKVDNLINMDTRTVISCIPYSMTTFTQEDLEEIKRVFKGNIALFNSIFTHPKKNMVPLIYHQINNLKMFNETENECIRLDELTKWKMQESEFICDKISPYKIIFCNIEIAGREVQCWGQPLLEAIGMATFGLLVCEEDNCTKFLVRLKEEVGSFDQVEIGPTVQLEPTESYADNYITKLFMQKWKASTGVLNDVILSEEGGRFYHEQNHNVIIKVEKDEIEILPRDYFWVDYYTLNNLIQINNCVNIQLRNLLALLEV